MEWIILLGAPIIGLLVGMLPSFGAMLAMLVLYPFLVQFDAFFIIIFYSIMISAREFFGSVSAIAFNVLGEITSSPVLAERPLIVKNNLQDNALRNTMYGSVFGMIFGCIILYFSILALPSFKFLLRSDVIAFILLVCTFFLIFWKQNSYMINLLLIIFGFTLGAIGYDHHTNNQILTFNNAYLSGGVPSFPLILGFYALPKMFDLLNHIKFKKPVFKVNNKITYKINFNSMLRGSCIGSIVSLIPFVGTTINSNMAHWFENFFHKQKSGKHALMRITSSEASNNAGQVTVLIPLLLLGLAIQPSEFVLLDLIDNKGWKISDAHDWKFISSLLISLAIGCIISSIFCYYIVRQTLHVVNANIRKIVYFLLVLSISNIFYLGNVADQTFYHFFIFVIFFFIGLFLCHKKIDALPLIVMFLLENIYSDAIKRVFQLM